MCIYVYNLKDRNTTYSACILIFVCLFSCLTFSLILNNELVWSSLGNNVSPTFSIPLVASNVLYPFKGSWDFLSPLKHFFLLLFLFISWLSSHAGKYLMAAGSNINRRHKQKNPWFSISYNFLLHLLQWSLSLGCRHVVDVHMGTGHYKFVFWLVVVLLWSLSITMRNFFDGGKMAYICFYKDG